MSIQFYRDCRAFFPPPVVFILGCIQPHQPQPQGQLVFTVACEVKPGKNANHSLLLTNPKCYKATIILMVNQMSIIISFINSKPLPCGFCQLDSKTTLFFLFKYSSSLVEIMPMTIFLCETALGKCTIMSTHIRSITWT